MPDNRSFNTKSLASATADGHIINFEASISIFDGVERDQKSKVIIVGNSPSILLQEYGELIDSYDVVIRVNRCLTTGFEKYIGKKIDIWATTRTDNIDDFVPENYKDIRYLWKRTHSYDLELPEDFPEEVQKEHYIMYKNQKWFKNYKTFLSPFELKHEPCTGLLTILTACRFYDDITVHGFTFGTQSDNKHRLSGYYRDSELISDDSGSLVHPEDELWYSERNTKIIGDRSESIKKREILKELVENGIPKKQKKHKNGFQVAHPPLNILNKAELEDMEI
jgi:hypothetical protein